MLSHAIQPQAYPACNANSLRNPNAMKNLLRAAILAAGLMPIQNATAQPYPSRPITMVLPFAAGGPTDTLARILAERMRAARGQPGVGEDGAGGAGTKSSGGVGVAAPHGVTVDPVSPSA